MPNQNLTSTVVASAPTGIRRRIESFSVAFRSDCDEYVCSSFMSIVCASFPFFFCPLMSAAGRIRVVLLSCGVKFFEEL